MTRVEIRPEIAYSALAVCILTDCTPEWKRYKHVFRVIESMGHLTPEELQEMADYAKALRDLRIRQQEDKANVNASG